MMTFLQVLVHLLLAAHFYRHGQAGVAFVSLAFIFLLFVESIEAKRILQLFNIVALVVWGHTFGLLFLSRLEQQLPYIRLLLIAISVLLFHAALIVVQAKKLRLTQKSEYYAVSVAFYSTIFSLLFISTLGKNPMLLGMRFFGELGLVQIFFHALYSGYLVKTFLSTKESSKIRIKIWSFFCLFFFGQLILGILGIDRFLMSGTLHYPLPALIISVPIYEGGFRFMILLFMSVVILVGPSWCSHLCYVGVVDQYMAKKKRPKTMPYWTKLLRLIILLTAIILPLGLNYFEAPRYMLHSIIIVSLLLSAAFMFTSSQIGQMVHCTRFCPIGVLSNYFGKLSPFRLKVLSHCNLCLGCVKSCKYGALDLVALEKKKIHDTCSLCLDCLNSCDKQALQLTFMGRNRFAKDLFYILVISLHSIFMAVARL